MFPAQPDFLVISPPKTGTTWLADNFRYHPDLFVPDIKEVKYFSSLHRTLDLDWYLMHFSPAGDRRTGDISPSYATLPTGMIRRIRDHFPNLKLIFLMRDPVERAWSHAKHAHRYREITFADLPHSPATDEQWRTVLANNWSLLSGDYLGHLRRWLAVFPPEQIFIGFYEDIINRPANLLQRVFQFLDVNPDIDLTSFPLYERILPGAPESITPELLGFLRKLLGPRTTELVAFLRDRFGLHPPAEWQTTLQAECAGETPEVFVRAEDDDYIAAVNAQEEDFPTAYREVHREYRGYDLVYYRGRLLAVDPSACGGGILGADNATIEELVSSGKCLVGDSLMDLKEQVVDRVLNQMERRILSVEANIQETTAAVEQTMAELARAMAEFRHRTPMQRAVRRVRRLTKQAVSFVTMGLITG